MKKIYYFIFVIVFIGCKVYGQAPEIEWQKSFNYAGVSSLFDLRKTADKGYVMLGYTGFNEYFETFRVAGSPEIAAWIIKTDSSGKSQWDYKNSFDANSFYSVAPTADGNYIACGYYNDMWTPGDILLEKLNGSGKLIWSKKLGGSAEEKAYSIQIAPDGGYVFAGLTWSNNGQVSGNHGNADIWVVKSDTAGTLLWQKCIGGSGNDTAYSIITASDGYYVAGTTTSGNGQVTGNAGNADAWLIKLDPDGNLVWQKTFGGTNNDVFRKLQLTADGGLIAVGYTWSNDGIVNGNHGNADIWVVKCDITGNLLWQKCYGGSNEDKGSDIKPVEDGGYVINSYAKSNNGNVNKNSGGADQWVIKIAGNGNIEWVKNIGSSSDDFSSAIITLDEYNYVTLCNKDGGAGVIYGILTKLGKSDVIKGTVYIDVNGNGVKDLSEPFFSDGFIKSVRTDGYSRMTEPVKGNFMNAVDPGAYQTSFVSYNSYYTAVPASYSSSFSGYYQEDSVNFRLIPTVNINDLQVHLLPTLAARPGFSANFGLTYKNAGTTSLSNVGIDFNIDPRCEVVSTSPAYTSVSGNLIHWDIGNLQSLDKGAIQVTLKVKAPPVVNINDTLRFSVTGYPVAGDQTPKDNTDTVAQIARGSFDPNDKTESHAGIISPEQIASNDYLTYLVRFQNTGTDTAFNIVVRDTIESRLDWNSFRMISASHGYSLHVADGNKFEWEFNNVNLPNSSINEPLSHGYIAYQIKPKSSVSPGDTIHNSASIYFDYNQPVNTDQLTLVKIAPPMQPLISNLLNSYCANEGLKKIKITNVTNNSTATVKLDNSLVPVAADSSFSFTVTALSTGLHYLTVSFSNSSGTKTTTAEFSVAPVVTPDVNLSANITQVTNLTNPVIITATNAAGGGNNPLYTFSRNRNFTDIIQTESTNNTVTIIPSGLAFGDNKVFVKMKTSEICYTSQTNIDSITIRRDQATGITDPDNPSQVIAVFPNPYSGPVTIKGLSASKTYVLSISDNNGQVIFTKRVSNHSETYINRLPDATGVYWLSIFDDKKKKLIGSIKLVKQ
jgi:uncharacterized repeat protein (TIGR01451 family)